MVVGDRCADAHEFLHADLDCAMAAVVLEMGNAVPSHVMLRAGLFVGRTIIVFRRNV